MQSFGFIFYWDIVNILFHFLWVSSVTSFWTLICQVSGRILGKFHTNNMVYKQDLNYGFILNFGYLR